MRRGQDYLRKEMRALCDIVLMDKEKDKKKKEMKQILQGEFPGLLPSRRKRYDVWCRVVDKYHSEKDKP